MPRRLCSTPRCGDTATYRGRCQAHARVKERETNRAGRSIYNTKRWKILRKRVLFEESLCPCGEIAVDVDHIVPLAQGGAPYDRSNCVGLCKRCHSVKTAREMRETSGPTWPD